MLDLGKVGAKNVTPNNVRAGEVVKFDMIEIGGKPVFAGLSVLVNELHTVHPNGKGGIEGKLLFGPLLDESAKAITSSARAKNVNDGGLYAAIWFDGAAETHEVHVYRSPRNLRELTSRWHVADH